MSYNNDHPTHPVRNFFYVLYSIVNALAFVGFFYALYSESLPARGILLGVFGAILASAVAFGIFSPFSRARR